MQMVVLKEMERLKILVQSAEPDKCRKETEQTLVILHLASLRMFRIRINW